MVMYITTSQNGEQREPIAPDAIQPARDDLGRRFQNYLVVQDMKDTESS